MSWLREDLDDIATVQLESQRNHAPVYFGSNARVPDLGVDRIGKIDGRRITRQHYDFAFRREGVNLLRIEIDLQSGKKLIGIGDIALPFHHLPHPCEPLLILRRYWTIRVLPVRG